jgi:CRISPR-associated protein Csd1
MLLTALKEYSARLPTEQQTPSMYAAQPVLYVVELGADGRYKGTSPTAVGGTGREARGIRLITPFVSRTMTIKSNLLMDNAEYALGVPKEGSKSQQTTQRHAAFVQAVRLCAEATGDSTVAAVVRFLEGPDANPYLPDDDFKPNENVTFRVDGDFPIDHPAVQAYWAEANGAGTDDSATPGDGDMACLLCGQVKPILSRIPFKHKNVPGGQTAGTALISANANAFESYGLAESLIAPVCHSCAEGFSKGLNALIEDDRTHLRRDPLLYIFWTRSGDFDPVALLDNPDPTQVRELLRAAETAQIGAPDAVRQERFYAASLAGSGGRLAVRDWLTTTVGEVRLNMTRFFKLQKLGDELRPYAAWRLARATVRDPLRDVAARRAAQELQRMALHGGSAPLDLLFGVVRRLRADQQLTRDRLALAKLVLLSQPQDRLLNKSWTEDALTALDRTESAPAYVCGRLLAVLEDVQRQALGDVNATIVDRYYGSASSTPIAVFARLLRGAVPHLARLRRDRPGAHLNVQRQLEEILGKLPIMKLPGGRTAPAFPRSLTLEQQALFALGYYHQRADRFGRRSAETDSDGTTPVATPTV